VKEVCKLEFGIGGGREQSAVRRVIFVAPATPNPAPSGRHKMSLLHGALEHNNGHHLQICRTDGAGRAKHPTLTLFDHRLSDNPGSRLAEADFLAKTAIFVWKWSSAGFRRPFPSSEGRLPDWDDLFHRPKVVRWIRTTISTVRRSFAGFGRHFPSSEDHRWPGGGQKNGFLPSATTAGHKKTVFWSPLF
jgi:hypothetical protein